MSLLYVVITPELIAIALIAVVLVRGEIKREW